LRDALIRAGAAVTLALAAGAGVAQDCPQELAASRTDGGWVRIGLRLRCAPYAPVTVTLGALRLAEELSLDGTLSLDLPPVRGAGEVVVEAPDARLGAAVPAAARPPDPFAAVIWPEGSAWGELAARGADVRRLGFAAPGRGPLAAVVALPEDGRAVLHADVTSESCGRVLEAAVLDAARATPAPLRLFMPGCHATGERLVLPLPR